MPHQVSSSLITLHFSIFLHEMMDVKFLVPGTGTSLWMPDDKVLYRKHTCTPLLWNFQCPWEKITASIAPVVVQNSSTNMPSVFTAKLSWKNYEIKKKKRETQGFTWSFVSREEICSMAETGHFKTSLSPGILSLPPPQQHMQMYTHPT